MAGLNVDRGTLDAAVGHAVLTLNVTIIRLSQLRDFVRLKTDQELVDMGYDAVTEIPRLRNGLDDMDLFYKIYRGAQPLATQQDFRDNIKRLWGMGVLQ